MIRICQRLVVWGILWGSLQCMGAASMSEMEKDALDPRTRHVEFGFYLLSDQVAPEIQTLVESLSHKLSEYPIEPEGPKDIKGRALTETYP